MRAIILAIGDELALGQTIDTNSAFLSARLAAHGIPTLAHETIADDLPAICDALRWASNHAQLVLVSGGLGPTEDDLTRQALAEVMQRPLVEDPASLQTIEGFFLGRGRPMPLRNRVQALHPEGSRMIPNACGTAPGIQVTLGQAECFFTPGVPREMVAMFADAIEPQILRHAGIRGAIHTLKINTFGLGESDLAERLGPLMARDRNPKVGTTAAEGLVGVRIRSEFPTAQDAATALEATAADVERALHPYAFGREEVTLPEAVVQLLLEKNLTVVTAESCTGGLIGSQLTGPAGASSVFLGGWVTYANRMKELALGVPAQVLETCGAVSGQVAEAMARGALDASGADLAVAVTGLAGPGGGSEHKPVGTVWFGLAWRDARGEPQAESRLARFSGNRAGIRERACQTALQWVRLHVLGESADTLRWTHPTRP